MRHGGWTWVAALATGLALTTLARADDDEAKPAKTGNWFTRLFSRDGAGKKKDAAQKEDAPAVATASVALQRQKAYGEWQRRLEVVQRLKQIALETGDAELDRKADALDQRAWEVYLQRTGGTRASVPVEEPSSEGRLSSETQRSGAAPSLGMEAALGTAGSDNRASARRE
jgi:hypothetical protein